MVSRIACGFSKRACHNCFSRDFTSEPAVSIFRAAAPGFPNLHANKRPEGIPPDSGTKHIVISVIAGAFSAGIIHVLSGPDHLAAVAPLSLNPRRRAWLTGMRWGLGHSAGVLIVGVLSLTLRGLLPLDLLSSWAERLVGVVLLGIGIWGLRNALTSHVHVHEHSHGGQPHAHIHVHGHETAHSHQAATSKVHTHSHTAFAVGTLHGLAGSSHFLGVLPAMAFPSTAQAAGYLIAYGLGSILAMAIFSTAMGWMTQGLASTGANAYRVVMTTSSVVALAVGGYWLVA